VGVAKKMMLVDGLTKASVGKAVSSSIADRVDLVGDSGRVWGAALRGRKSTNPVYVSVGHR
jgi:deoxyinosine 3'endonuclease (endonuclease V)